MRKRRQSRRLEAALAAVLCCAAGAPRAAAEAGAPAPPTVMVDERNEVHKSEVGASSGLYTMKSSQGQTNGVETDAFFHYAATERVGFGPRLRQAYAQDKTAGIVTLFTGISLDLEYALTGTLLQEQTTTYLQDQPVVLHREPRAGGLRAIFSVSQFFINTTKVAVPFSGVGFGLRYDLSLDFPFSPVAGISVDRLTNSELMLVPTQMYLGLNYVL